MSAATNIVITGFMGSGKTTVGQILARQLNREFVDMDALIEERARMTITQIFARHGECFFRTLERGLAHELTLRKNLVIATGGGALVNEETRQMMDRHCTVVCLAAGKLEIASRLAEAHDRPLAPDWESLYAVRQAAYREIKQQIVTTGKTPQEIACEIAVLDDGPIQVKTPAGDGYPILIAQGLLAGIANQVDTLELAQHVLVVTNETVAPLYGEQLASALPKADLITVPDGEAYKNLDTVRMLYDRMLALGADRNTTLIALGGGVIGDMAGYVAATYMRGIPLMQIPTSLLSMVDSSVGGKVGVDLPQGKNLIGAFKQPQAVIIDTDVLDTLPALQWRCGMAEVIKHGLIADPSLLQPALWRPEQATRLVRQAVRVKVNVVEQDPYERGIRAHLNLGHTFGHAIEKVTQYAVPHGEAVAIGLVKAAKLSHNLGYIDADLVRRIEMILEEIGLPTDIGLDPESWYDAMSTDKKWKAGVSHLVVLKALGEATVVAGLPKEEIMAVL